METKEIISNNVNTTLIKTDKFKTISFQITFLGEFSQKTATARSLLTRLLSNANKKYPTKKAISNRLLDLYDASFSIMSYPSYKTSITSFNLDIVNQKNVKSTTLTKEALEFLREAIFNPNFENNLFPEKDFQEQKRTLRENIKNIYNNKNRYALRQMLRKMAPNEIISVSSIGDLEELDRITNEELVALYQRMLTEENVSIHVVGDFEDQEIIEALSILGPFPVNTKKYPTVSEEEIQVEKVREFSESQHLNQSKLMMGFRSNINTKSSLFPACLLFNAMYGGIFTSDLSRVVREENSLAYTIAAQFMSDVKVLVVMAGIDKDKYQFTSDLVIKELERYREGRIDKDLLEIARDSILTELEEVEDNPQQLIGFALRNYLHDLNYTVPGMIEIVKSLTIEDVKAAAQGIYLDTIFLLASEDRYDKSI
ncbi:MAG: insulinase family protein [Acholeplasmataceae bacterium]|nr:insulinase family protein [Acholeplasmataceae bacterium]